MSESASLKTVFGPSFRESACSVLFSSLTLALVFLVSLSSGQRGGMSVQNSRSSRSSAQVSWPGHSKHIGCILEFSSALYGVTCMMKPWDSDFHSVSTCGPDVLGGPVVVWPPKAWPWAHGCQPQPCRQGLCIQPQVLTGLGRALGLLSHSTSLAGEGSRFSIG